MPSLILRIASPLISLVLISIGGGFLGTLLSIRLEMYGASDFQIGLLTTAFYLGYIVGAFKIEAFLIRVGHIRAYAVFAAIIASITLIHGMLTDPWLWIIWRFLYGFGMAGLFLVVESWLIILSNLALRGRVLALYMIAFYAAQSLGQLLLKMNDIQTMLPFCICAVLASLSILPLASTKIPSPQFSEHSTLKLKELYKLSPAGIWSAFAGGMVLAVIYGLMPVHLRQNRFSLSDIAYFMAIVVFGGMMLQYPIGKMSDFIDRRWVLIGVLALTMVFAGLMKHYESSVTVLLICAFFFGGLTFTIYPLSTNLLCDLVDEDNTLAAISSLLIAYSVGACISPMIAPFLMHYATGGIYYFFIIIAFILTLGIGWRLIARKPVCGQEQEPFMPIMYRTTPVAFELNPRIEDTSIEDDKEGYL